MPSHADRVRTAPLPAEYQFGDARWRRPSDNAAEQLARRGWNVIEGEHHESDHKESTT